MYPGMRGPRLGFWGSVGVFGILLCLAGTWTGLIVCLIALVGVSAVEFLRERDWRRAREREDSPKG